MVKKMQKTSTDRATESAGGHSVKGSAQQIWQAGLGAIAKAQAEGAKALESLVKEGTNMQRKTQAVAEEKISEATSRMTAMAGDITNKASGQWDKLENIFEERVAKALNKLGVPSAKDVNALIARIDELNASVRQLTANAAKTPKASAKSVAKPATKPANKPVDRAGVKRSAKAPVKRAAAGK